MRYEDDGNKALSKAAELAERGAGALTIVPTPAFVTPRNVRHIVEEHDIVFLCVDNHSTRRTVSRRCRKLDNVLLISGGNDGVEKGRSGTFGNVMVYRRAAGVDVTHPLTRFHPEIARPADKRPDELSCAELAKTSRASASVHELARRLRDARDVLQLSHRDARLRGAQSRHRRCQSDACGAGAVTAESGRNTS